DAELDKSTFVTRYGLDEAARLGRAQVERALDALRQGGLGDPALPEIARYVVERTRRREPTGCSAASVPISLTVHGNRTNQGVFRVALLERIRDPRDLRALPRSELRRVVDEVRQRHIDVVSEKGGHFGASLGVAELTVALHYVFETPRDQLVWDTGHQAYIHKILTGRNERLPTIRQRGGLAPFLRRDESEYDTFGAGHASTSISAAWGMAVGRDLVGEDFRVVAVIGDGAMGCGLAYEALNNAGHTQRDFTVVLNDNDMSIAPAVGAMNKYLTGMITNPAYNKARNLVKEILHRAPSSIGGVMEEVAGRLEESVKHMLTPGLIFEELGFRYVGPVDGHDVDSLVDTLGRVREMRGPILVHVLTQKGKGFDPAEADPWTWHAAGPFDKVTGKGTKKGGGLPRYQKVFGEGLVQLADQDPRVVAITAAMPDGTSTDIFQRAHPDRYFDVGIAEGHGVTFAAGLATRGIKPVVAIYSTFLQRAFDSIVHDVALQGLPVIFGMDRAGIAGEDGPTHHGTLDLVYMLGVPGMTVTAPRDGSEMLALLRLATERHDGPWSLRWPRDAVPAEVPHLSDIPDVEPYTWEILRNGADAVILAVGTMVGPSLEAAERLADEGIRCTVVNCRFLKPYDEAVFLEMVRSHPAVLTVEEGQVVNGFGAFLAREVDALDLERRPRMASMGIPDHFVEHGPRAALLADLDLDARGVAERVRSLVSVREAGALP
ncbi:MAG TPA: 1-deoxy-D-xylulose-5-phosphate synthase, partial [Longimicrobiales bacterium]|nr:1-deoxy-D-xylulose-5-phosphate synthase [Longimicrobiales bacterium]